MREQSTYYQHGRGDLLRCVPKSARRVLDIGCGAGALGASIKRRQPALVIGIEYVVEQATRAASVLDAVHTGDAATLALPYAAGAFDCLIYGDVLEHTVDPWALLAQQRHLLAESGTLIVSLPNVQFIGVIFGLLRGRWEYQARGVLDRTHLRFFTRRSALALLAGAGYRVVQVQRNMRWFDAPGSPLHRYARLLEPLPWLRDVFTYQYVLVAQRTAD